MNEKWHVRREQRVDMIGKWYNRRGPVKDKPTEISNASPLTLSTELAIAILQYLAFGFGFRCQFLDPVSSIQYDVSLTKLQNKVSSCDSSNKLLHPEDTWEQMACATHKTWAETHNLPNLQMKVVWSGEECKMFAFITYIWVWSMQLLFPLYVFTSLLKLKQRTRWDEGALNMSLTLILNWLNASCWPRTGKLY